MRGDAVNDIVKNGLLGAAPGSVGNAGSMAIDGMVSHGVGNDNGGNVLSDVLVGSRGGVRWQAGQLPVKLWPRNCRRMATM